MLTQVGRIALVELYIYSGVRCSHSLLRRCSLFRRNFLLNVESEEDRGDEESIEGEEAGGKEIRRLCFARRQGDPRLLTRASEVRLTRQARVWSPA